MRTSKRMLIIDQLNLFFRNYIVNPSISLNGSPIGALKGCFQSLQKIIRESRPDMVVICWDGAGGSQKRKLLNKNYKDGRKPIRLNRSVKNLTRQEEIENKIWQQTRLIEYFNHTPVVQFMFDGIEADDVIAYVSNLSSFSEWEKLIVSSDKDFFQLLNKNTVLYRPIQKEVLNERSILEKFNIHPNNFAMARAMVGDRSDNLDGMPGVGLKTVAKRFPFLSKAQTATFEDVFNHCTKSLESRSVKAYESVIENDELLKRNYKMMQLYSPLLTIDAKKQIRQTLADPDNSFNKTELIKMMMSDGFGEINFIELFRHFNKMSVDS